MKTRFLLRAFAVFCIATLGFAPSANAQLQVIPGGTAPYNPAINLISNVLLGAGVTLVGTPVYSGVPLQVGYFNGTGSNIGLNTGVVMSTGPAARAIGPNDTPGNGGFFPPDDVGGTTTDANISAIATNPIVDDIAKFDFDFIPLADTLTFRYVFASEEYPEFACTNFNDVFGFFVTGARPASLGGGTYNNTNIAIVPGTTSVVSINTINGVGSSCGVAGVNPQFYRSNAQVPSTTIQYDGFTTVLTAMVVVVPCTQYHIKLAIGDVGDADYDSAVFLEASSFGTGLVSTTTITPQPDGTISEGGATAQVCFSIPVVRTVGSTINYTLGGTATPGVDYTVTPAVLVIPAGQTQGCVTFTPLTDVAQEVTETIRVFVQASPCRRDTFDIDLIDPLIVAPVINDVALCNGAPGVPLDASQTIIIPAPRVFSSAATGTVTCACPSPNPPGPPVVTSIPVFGVAGQFNATNAQMRVCVNITHTNIGDVDMYLIDPCGDVLELATDVGGGGDNMTNTCFVVGSAAPTINSGTAPFTGNFTPEGAWSTLNGCNYNGTWRLQVGDDSNPTNGTLNGWSITFPPSYSVNYAWSPGTGLSCTNCATPIANPTAPSTTYTVTVSDAYGTSVTDAVTITRIASYPKPIITCGAATTSSVSFNWNTIGGTTSYEVSQDLGLTWATNGTSTTYSLSGTSGQSKCISVRGVGTCPADSAVWCCTIPVVPPPCPLAATLSAPVILCINGTTDITTTVAGSTAALTYQLAAGAQQASPVFTGISAGTYTVTVRQSATCSTNSSITITNPTAVSVSIALASIDSVNCFGESNGRATALAVGGNNVNYSYTWCNGEIGSNALSLAAGICAVTATDANGCLATTTVTIGQPVVLVASIVSSTPLLCNNGLPTATATATATGGTRNYRYLWDAGATTATATGLSLGIHTVTVTDKNGCISSATVTIGQPTPVSVTALALAPTLCFLSADGRAQGTATGGTGPNYTYRWDATILANPALTLNAGIHTVVATDANGCTGSSTVTIVQPTQIMALASTTATGGVSCFGGTDGDATVVPSGGTPNYTYAWSTGGPVQSPNNVLPQGTHTVTVTDANGCFTTSTVVVIQPTQMTATAATTSNITCFGLSNGVGAATVGGGTPPYNYSWDNGSTTNPATNLNAGTRTVTVRDANNCITTASTLVLIPTQVLPTTSVVNNVSCFGGSNGSANVVGAGGTPPYTYIWDNGQAFTPATNLFPTLHFVTVTDAANCSNTASVTIAPAPALSVTTSLIQTISCPTFGDGSIQANVLGGTPPYTYSWSSSEIVNPAALLFVGAVSVTVTDAAGCTAVANATMTEPTALSLAFVNTTNVTCFGGANGATTIDVTGGTPLYTYAWDITPNTGDSPINLPVGTHTVTVTDSRLCVATASVDITEPTLLVPAAVETTAVTCFGLANGVANASATGGVPPYIYLWSDGLGSQPAPTTCSAGTHTVTISDANGCSFSTTMVTTQPPAVNVTAIANTLTTCNGALDGTATATGTGGIAPYLYVWDNGDQNAVVTTLPSGPHTVTVTDANGCASSTAITILEPAVLLVTAIETSSVSCATFSDGAASATVTGGTQPYTYSWDGGASSSPNPTTFAAGLHTVIVTDANACATTTTVLITEPLPVSAIAVQTLAISCKDLINGHATVTPAGGVQSFTYLWNNSATTQSITNADDGTITVTVTDANNCSFTTTAVISEPSLLTATTTTTANLCFEGSDGTATVIGSGGITPYTYEWSIGQIITPLATGLPFGTFTVTITDANGCVTTATAAVREPATISLTTTQTNIACYGNLSGSATVVASGGTQTIPYTYLWSDAQPTATAVALGRGFYSVTVTDGNGCTKTTSVNILESPILVATPNSTNIACNGAQNGAVAVVAQGGTGIGTYLYNWNTPNTNLTPQVGGLSSGVYVVTVTDGNGCTRTTQAQVQEPAPLVIGMQVTDLLCNGAGTGQITANVAGGTGLPTYLWSDVLAQTTGTAIGLAAGIYTVTVTDANGCTKTASANLSEPTAMTLQITQIATKCYLSADGSATVAAGGASGGYNYQWSTSPAQIVATATGLIAGVYTVTVTDRTLFCTQVAFITVEQPTALSIQMSMTAVRCSGENTATVTALVTGGTSGNNGGYNYSWSGVAAAQNTPTATNLPIGTYTVTVADANACYATSSVEVTSLPTVDLSIETQVVKCFGQSNGSAVVHTVGGTGFGTYTYVWNTPTAQTDSLAIGLGAGTYIVTVTDTNNCTATMSAIIGEPQELLLNNVTITPVSCKGGSDGVAVVSPQGGNNTSPYTFSWNTTPPQITETASGLVAGTYNVSVTDIKGCSTNTQVTISEPLTVVSTEMSFAEPTCYLGSNGTATVLASGGTTTVTSSYTYLWNGGQNLATATNFSAGIYTVLVTDIKGCTATGRVVILQPSPITTASINTLAPSCHDGRDGSSTIFGSGGTPGYTYLWGTVPPRAGDYADGLFGGATYIVTATDVKGCTGTGTVSIPNPAPLTIEMSTVAANCFGNGSGTATVAALGGTPAYSYFWSNNSTNATATGLSAGVYAVTVTDFKGCSNTGSITVVQGSTLSIRSTSKAVRCFGESNGIATAIASGGAPNYTYTWNNAAVNVPSQNNLPKGTYTVTITDRNLCTVTTSIEVTQPSALIALATPTDLRCYASLDGQIQVDVTGGTVPYRYTFNTGLTPSTNATYIGARAGTYNVTVRDVNGCTATTTTTINEPQQLKVDAGNDLQMEFGQTPLPELTAISNDIAANFNWSATPIDSLLTAINAGNAQITVNPLSDTYYYVTATDSKGCTASDRVQITVNATRRVFVATAFSPNNDTYNDALFVQGGIGTVLVKSFKVFNRWGELVFESKDTAPNIAAYGWNGTYKDEVVDPAVFVWVAVVEFADGQVLTYKGDTAVLK